MVWEIIKLDSLVSPVLLVNLPVYWAESAEVPLSSAVQVQAKPMPMPPLPGGEVPSCVGLGPGSIGTACGESDAGGSRGGCVGGGRNPRWLAAKREGQTCKWCRRFCSLWCTSMARLIIPSSEGCLG